MPARRNSCGISTPSGCSSSRWPSDDARIYADALDGSVYHYRDSDGLEVDLILETRGGTWGAFEVKLGPGQVDRAASSLLRFAAKVDTDKAGPRLSSV